MKLLPNGKIDRLISLLNNDEQFKNGLFVESHLASYSCKMTTKDKKWYKSQLNKVPGTTPQQLDVLAVASPNFSSSTIMLNENNDKNLLNAILLQNLTTTTTTDDGELTEEVEDFFKKNSRVLPYLPIHLSRSISQVSTSSTESTKKPFTERRKLKRRYTKSLNENDSNKKWITQKRKAKTNEHHNFDDKRSKGNRFTDLIRCDAISKKTLFSLIAALNLTFSPDYDFSSLTARDFVYEHENEMVINRINELFSTSFSDYEEEIRKDLWKVIDEEINLKQCNIYSYRSNGTDPFGDSAGVLWSFNYFLFNKKRKRIFFINSRTLSNWGREALLAADDSLSHIVPAI
ncbi:hypothetical protein SNEBB_002159 [Seison nebaliae]|nr:hypothetical protein SNEBB_002159 [Seison nebaliae]